MFHMEQRRKTMSETLREEFKSLILNTCNTVGCEDCPFKWEKDSDGNSCRSDYLQHKLFDLEKDNERDI